MVNFSMLCDSKPLGFQHENGYAIFYTFFGYIILFRCGQSFITSKVLSTAFEEVQLSAPLPPPRSDDSAYAPGSYLLTSASGWPFPYLITSLRLCLWVALVRIYYYHGSSDLQATDESLTMFFSLLSLGKTDKCTRTLHLSPLHPNISMHILHTVL